MYCRVLEGKSVEYDDCPVVCNRQEPRINIYRNDLCEGCPRNRAKKDFLREVLRLWEEWLEGHDIGHLTPEKMLTFLYGIFALQKLDPAKVEITHKPFLDAFDAERSRDQKEKAQINSL